MSDKEKFIEEMLSHKPELKGKALKYCKHEQKAEDLIQDTFIKAMKNWESFEMGTNMRAWLHTILRNTFINQYRKEEYRQEYKRKATNKRDQQLENFISTHEPLDHIKGLESKEEIDYLVEKLKENVKEPYIKVLLKADLHDKKYREISEELDIPIGTVMSRLYRGRKEAKIYLASNYEPTKEIIDEETLKEWAV